MVFLHLTHDFVGAEFLMVIHKNRGTGKPLPIELSPYSLAPTRIGNGKMNAVFMQVVPKDTCGEMAQRIEKIVCHHLRLTACSAGEIHKHGVLVAVHMLRTNKGWRLCTFLVPIVEAFRNDGTNGNKSLDGRTFRHGLLNLLENVGFTRTDNSLHTGPLVTIYDVVLGKHVSGRNCHGTNLMQRQHGKPPLVMAFENQHHLIVVPNTELCQVGSNAVRFLLDVLKGKPKLFTLFVCP